MMLRFLFLIFFSSYISECVGSRSECYQRIDVDQQEFGVVYEYVRDEMTCSYDFQANEGQRIMLAISHIGLLPKNSNEDCIPKISILDYEGKDVVICNSDDAKTKGAFVSTSSSARIKIEGHSESNGILLIQFWFVTDVTLIAKPRTPSPTEAERLISVRCPSWDADFDIESCACEDQNGGEITDLVPPFCLPPTETLPTRCLREENEGRHQLAYDRYFQDGVVIPPSCDSQGNYEKLQCGTSRSNICVCVDPVSGIKNYLIPPTCENQVTTETPLTTTIKSPAPVCILRPCGTFCPYGQESDYAGCPICSCKDYVTPFSSKTCQEATIRLENEITQWKELAVKTTPYPWIHDCLENGSYKSKQCNYIAGCFCVDQETGLPNGKINPNCETYKKCVTMRIQAIYLLLRDAGYKKTSKEVRKLLSGNDANNIQFVMDMLSVEERNNILTYPDTHIPICNDYGDYEALQCRTAEGTCWCVDVNGEKITGSESSRVVPDCSIYSRQDYPMPESTDPNDGVLILQNNTAQLSCNFKTISEVDDMFIYWTQNGIPVSSFNDTVFEVHDVHYMYPNAQHALVIDNVEKKYDGEYRCEIADTSRDYFYKSQPITLKAHNVQEDEYVCLIKPCDIYCSLGYKTDDHDCPICECLKPEEFISWSVLYRMKFDLIIRFGVFNRCEAERQMITKRLLEGSIVEETLPQCDSDGNYEEIQNVKNVGNICVQKLLGLPTGRLVPDCKELTPCIQESVNTSEAHIAFFTNDSVLAKSIAESAVRVELRIQHLTSLEDYYLLELPNQVHAGDASSLPPTPHCDYHTGMYSYMLPVCTGGLEPECWCIDVDGNEIEGSRAGVDEEMPLCNVPENMDGPNLINTGVEELHIDNGTTLTLACNVTRWSPGTYVMWTTPSGLTLEQMMVIDDRYEQVGDQVTDYAMRITNIQEKDKGVYLCSLINYRSRENKIRYSVNVR